MECGCEKQYYTTTIIIQKKKEYEKRKKNMFCKGFGDDAQVYV